MKISYIREGTGSMVELTNLISKFSNPLYDAADLDPLIEAIGNSKYVLLGEASHGTHEYYTWRAALSKRLIEEKGFSFIAVEGDWPDCYQINRYVKGYKDAGDDAKEVCSAFNRWPTWMWGNWETVALAEWMRAHNASMPQDKKAGFYGLDVYSLWESLETVIGYLDKIDPKAKETALRAWHCFEPYSDNEGRSYAEATKHAWLPASCESEVVDLLVEIRQRMHRYNSDPEAELNMERNAATAVNAERYYRAMVNGGPLSWNIRDHHMVETLNKLTDFHGPHAKAIVWEHNTHIGDARATDMIEDRMVNVGQILNETHILDGVYAVGFGSYKGTVIAGRYWNDVMRVMHVPDAIIDSWEHIMHQSPLKNQLLIFEEPLAMYLSNRRFGHRAIGVVYHPEREHGNYVPSIMPLRYNAFIHIDETRALHPLHIKPGGWQMPETYPFGL